MRCEPWSDPEAVLSGVPRVDSDFVGSKAYAMLEALFEKNSIKSQI